ncbi:MAG TPA: class I SAM-dependent rRNA methyltransferase, partial [Candidatus Avibacteroides excrementipullorum]|nr:class I SAM-dependent rRNA methyltransferase [Candidatus Avibacteroides excrementipullorum]
MYHKIFLKKGKDESLRRFHPWIFSGAIRNIEGNVEEGDIVEVYTHENEYIATGHYQIGSIAVRVLTFEKTVIDKAFYRDKLQTAYRVREAAGIANRPGNNTFRLVHGEGDNLPGLVIDIYGKTAVMQAHSIGMHKARHIIAETLLEIMGATIENIYYKSETTLPFKANLDDDNE